MASLRTKADGGGDFYCILLTSFMDDPQPASFTCTVTMCIGPALLKIFAENVLSIVGARCPDKWQL